MAATESGPSSSGGEPEVQLTSARDAAGLHRRCITPTVLVLPPIPVTPATPSPPAPLTPEDFDALDIELDLLREDNENVPEWEFCEGFLAALVCMRREVPPEEY